MQNNQTKYSRLTRVGGCLSFLLSLLYKSSVHFIILLSIEPFFHFVLFVLFCHLYCIVFIVIVEKCSKLSLA